MAAAFLSFVLSASDEPAFRADRTKQELIEEVGRSSLPAVERKRRLSRLLPKGMTRAEVVRLLGPCDGQLTVGIGSGDQLTFARYEVYKLTVVFNEDLLVPNASVVEWVTLRPIKPK